MTEPTVTLTTTTKSDTEIDFSGTITGLTGSQGIVVEVIVSTGDTVVTQAQATTEPVSTPTPSPTPEPTPTPSPTPSPTATPAPTPTPTPTPTPSPTPSPDDTVVTDTTGMITDGAGNVWTITADGQVAVNGVADPLTGGDSKVIKLAYVAGVIWQENDTNMWWFKTKPDDAWGPDGGTATSPLPPPPTPSPTPTATPSPTPSPTASPTPTPAPTPTPKPAATWEASSFFPLSPDKLTATVAQNGTKGAVLASAGKTSGKWYWNIRVIKGAPNFAVGLANAAFPKTLTFLGDDNNSAAFYAFDLNIPLTFWINNKIAGVPANITAIDVDGTLFRLAWDADKRLLFVQSPEMVKAIGPHAWNNQANADPVTGAGGLDVSALGTGMIWPALGMAEPGSAGQLVAAGLTDAPVGYSLLA